MRNRALRQHNGVKFQRHAGSELVNRTAVRLLATIHSQPLSDRAIVRLFRP